jgi:hypothetical protein
MRRALWSRVFAGVWALWFAVALTEPAGLHACPMHGVAHGLDPASAGAHGAAMHHGGGADGASHSVPGSHHLTCTCIGACCAAAVSVFPPSAAVAIAETIVRASPATHVVPTTHRPSEPEHARPPSQGPPLSLA